MSDQYTISGTQADQQTNGAAVTPFGTVVITNTDDEAYGTATVTLTNPANGMLSNLGIGTLSADGTTYTVSASPAAIQAALNGLVFPPTPNEAPPGTGVTPVFGLSLADANGGAASNTSTSVVATAVAQSPTVTFATRAPGMGQIVQAGGAAGAVLEPFANTTIADPKTGALDTTSITLTVGGAASDANGTLSGAGLTEASPGTYVLAAATPAAETTALQNLAFSATNPGTGSSTGVTIQVSDGVAAPVTAAYQDGSTAVPPDADPPGYLSLGQNPGGSTMISNSETTNYIYNNTAVNNANHNYSTTIDAVLDDSQVVYEKTFDLPYSDPAVQMAVAQAENTLASDDATSTPAATTASNLANQGDTTSVAQTGQSQQSTITTTETFGPAFVGPGTNVPAGNPNTFNPRGFLYTLPGQLDINVNTETDYTIDETTTTTTTDLLAQQYTIFGTSVTCFAAGTRIRVWRDGGAADVVVERLAVGDLAVTASCAHRPIRWLGHRTIDCRAHPDSHAVWPIRVRAGAFGGGLPERDLHLSPGHPVRVGKGAAAHLVPIMCLVNGTSIARMPVNRVTYWHVELDRHDLLLAEGLAAESYLDWGDRPWFEEGADHALMNPDFVVPGLAGRCLPVALDGPLVEAERRRLDAVFATQLAGACAWPDRMSLGAVVEAGF